ncbi:MAG: glycosyltransferase, partial [Chromatiales bacterium]|nr:glycosyltransferase [Chromatiales bacterium]
MAERKLKVVQVLPALDGGGVERGTLEVADALVQAGHESVVVSAGGRMVAELEGAGSRHVVWNLGKKSPLTLLQVPLVRRWLQRERADILHLRSRMPAWILWLAWCSLPVDQRPKLVTTVHGLYSVSGYSRIMCRGERVIAVSKTVENYIFQNYPQTEKERVRLIYRGVDPAAFPRGYRPEPAWLENWYR